MKPPLHRASRSYRPWRQPGDGRCDADIAAKRPANYVEGVVGTGSLHTVDRYCSRCVTASLNFCELNVAPKLDAACARLPFAASTASTSWLYASAIVVRSPLISAGALSRASSSPFFAF